MAVKPIVKIEVDDSKFKRFFQDFQKYDALLKAQVAVWGQVNAAMANSSKSLIPNFMTLGSITKTIAENLASAFRSLRDLAGLGAIAGLAGFGGSLFGINALANAASAFQRQSGGLGSTTGAMLAFRLNNERYVNPDSLLEKAADAKSDVTKRIPLNFLGVSNFNQDPAQIAYESMLGMRNMYQRYGGNTNILDSLGLNQLFSHDEMRRLGTSAPGQLELQHQQEIADRKKLELTKQDAQQWQDLKTRLGVASDAIEITFIRGLIPLAGPLTELSTRFNELATVFLKSPIVEEAVTGLAHGLHELSDYMQKPAFKKDVDDILEDLKSFGAGVKNAALSLNEAFGAKGDSGAWLPEWVKNIPILGPIFQGVANAGKSAGYATGNAINSIGQRFGAGAADATVNPLLSEGALRAKMNEIEQQHGLPLGLIWAAEGAESSHNTDKSTWVENKDGSLGPLQLSVDEAKTGGISSGDRRDRVKSAYAYAVNMERLYKKYGDIEESIAAYNEGEGNLDSQLAMAKRTGKDWHLFLPEGTNKNGYKYNVGHYVSRISSGLDTGQINPDFRVTHKSHILIENNTGGGAMVITRSLNNAVNTQQYGPQ